MVVETRPEDLDGELKPFLEEAMREEAFAQQHADLFEAENPLRVMYLQEAIERACWMQGGRTQVAPAQRMADFVNNPPQLRPSEVELFSWPHLLAAPFLDAALRCLPSGRRFQAVWP